MARAKSDRARSKALAVDDLTQSIEQLQAFIPKLEDLGREGFPYLEGAQTRTELQLRECIKRAFGEKSQEFQTHRHLKLSISSSTEKKQTLSLIRNLIASLEDKKLELQGVKSAVAEDPALSSHPPQMALVPPAVPPAQVSVTSVTTTPRPTAATLHLVPDVDKAPQPATPAVSPSAAADAPAAPIVEFSHAAAATQPVQPSRAPLEPISSLFRTQETKPVPAAPEGNSALPLSTLEQATAPTSSPDSAPPAVSPLQSMPLEAPAPVAPPAPKTPTVSTSVAPKADGAPHTFSATQEVPVPASPSDPQVAPPVPVAAVMVSATREVDYLCITKELCQRFHMVARQLRLRGEYRPTVNIEDEFDVQDLAHALLRLHFDDIGTDEWTPSYTDGTSRTTFLLDHDRLAVVVKKTRAGLSRKHLMDQVRADVERYRARGRCTHLLCFIYDPEGRIGNPSGFESELNSTSEHFTVDLVVAPK